MINNLTMETTETTQPQTQETTKSVADFNLYDTPATNVGEPVEIQTPETAETTTDTTTTATTPEKPVETVTEPVVTEKVVEKIVEKYPEFKDEYSKQLFEAIQNGKEDELYAYLSKKNKDYEVMADIDVVKENLKLQNPKWSDKDVEIEVKSKFGRISEKKDLESIDETLYPEEYQKALEFNERIEEKEMLLSREARDARIALEESKKNIEFPKIAQEAPEQVTITQEQIDESYRAVMAELESEMPKLTEFKFKVGDEDVSYKITDADRQTQTDYMKKLVNGEANVALDLGWIDANGKENFLKIAEDMLKLKNLGQIVSSAGSQVKTSTTKEIVADIKNIDLTPSSSTPDTSLSVADLIWK